MIATLVHYLIVVANCTEVKKYKIKCHIKSEINIYTNFFKRNSSNVKGTLLE